jgi:hypothetical protein
VFPVKALELRLNILARCLLAYLDRIVWVVGLYASGDISAHSLRLALRLEQRAVCLKSGGMVFCDQESERTFFS